MNPPRHRRQGAIRALALGSLFLLIAAASWQFLRPFAAGRRDPTPRQENGSQDLVPPTPGSRDGNPVPHLTKTQDRRSGIAADSGDDLGQANGAETPLATDVQSVLHRMAALIPGMTTDLGNPDLLRFLDLRRQLTRFAWSSRENFLLVVDEMLKCKSRELFLDPFVIATPYPYKSRLAWTPADFERILMSLPDPPVNDSSSFFLTHVMRLMTAQWNATGLDLSTAEWIALSDKVHGRFNQCLRDPICRSETQEDLLSAALVLSHDPGRMTGTLLDLTGNQNHAPGLRNWALEYLVARGLRFDVPADLALFREGIQSKWSDDQVYAALSTLGASPVLEGRVPSDQRSAVAQSIYLVLESDVEGKCPPSVQPALAKAYSRVLAWGGGRAVDFLMADSPAKQMAGAAWMQTHSVPESDVARCLIRACDLVRVSGVDPVRWAMLEFSVQHAHVNRELVVDTLSRVSKADQDESIRQEAARALDRLKRTAGEPVLNR